MNRTQPFLSFGCLVLALFAFEAKGATVKKEITTVTTTVEEPDTARDADNSGVNETHRGKLSADDQGMNRSDTDITAGIRRKIVGDDLLSTYAHNVKIITKNGRVTLKGPVRSEAEKVKIGRVANEIAGAKRVTNLMNVSPITKEGE